MSASPAERRRPAGGACAGLLALLVVAAPALGQATGSDGPLDILAPAADAAGEADRTPAVPAPIGPIPPAPDRADAASGADGTAEPVTAGASGDRDMDDAGGRLTVESVGETAAGWAGPLDPGDGGLGAALWEGTPATLVLGLLDQMGGNVPRGAAPLLERLLLSNSRPPAGTVPADADRPGVTPERLLVARLDQLLALGALEAAGELLDAHAGGESAAVKRRRAERQLLAGNLGEACALTAGGDDSRDGPFWAKLRIACNIKDGARARADLGRDVLAESGHAAPIFFALADALVVGDKPDPTRLAEIEADWSPITVALLRQTALAIAVAPDRAATPGVLAALARSGRLTTAAELRVTERAVAARALPATALARRYGALAFDRAALDRLLADAEGRQAATGAEEAARLAGHDRDGPRRRALLFRGAQIELADAPRAEILRLGIIDARRSGHLDLFARVVAPLLDDVAPSAELAWFAPYAARAYFALDRPERAAAWLALSDGADSAARVALAPLRPFVGAAADALPGAQALGLAEWQAALLNRAAPRATTLRQRGDSPFADAAADMGRGDARRHLRLASTLHNGLGAPVPAAIWQHLAAGRDASGPGPTGAIDPARATAWQALREAARAGRRGETVLLALAVLAGDDPASLPPPLAADALAGLRAVGADDTARAVARASALAAGL